MFVITPKAKIVITHLTLPCSYLLRVHLTTVITYSGSEIARKWLVIFELEKLNCIGQRDRTCCNQGNERGAGMRRLGDSFVQGSSEL